MAHSLLNNEERCTLNYRNGKDNIFLGSIGDKLVSGLAGYMTLDH